MKSELSANIRFLIKQHYQNNEQIFASDCGLSTDELYKILEINSNPALEAIAKISDKTSYSFEQLLNVKLETKIKLLDKDNIKLLVLDVDGVLTDGGMYYSESGDEMKKFNTKDGMAIKLMMKKGIKVAFLSSGFNKKLIQARGKLLGINYIYAGGDAKIDILSSWLAKESFDFKNIAYIGDDVNDIECMSLSGFSACPADACPEVRAAVDLIIDRNGGNACLRRFYDLYIK